MGKDKAFLPVEDVPLLLRQVRLLREAGMEDVFISGRPGVDYSSAQCPVVLDQHPDRGPIEGIRTTLGLLQKRATHLVVLAVDLPRMSAAFITNLLGRCAAGLGVVPVMNGRREPLAAVYPADMLQRVEAACAAGAFALQPLIEQAVRNGQFVELQVTAAEGDRLYNWNYPEGSTSSGSSGIGSVAGASRPASSA